MRTRTSPSTKSDDLIALRLPANETSRPSLIFTTSTFSAIRFSFAAWQSFKGALPFPSGQDTPDSMNDTRARRRSQSSCASAQVRIWPWEITGLLQQSLTKALSGTSGPLSSGSSLTDWALHFCPHSSQKSSLCWGFQMHLQPVRRWGQEYAGQLQTLTASPLAVQVGTERIRRQPGICESRPRRNRATT